MKTQEKVIKYLLSLTRDYNGGKLVVLIGRKEFNESKIAKIGESELINQLSIMEVDGLIRVIYKTKHRDLTYAISVELCSGVLHYFDNKKANIKSRFFDIVKWMIPTIISIIALIKSFIFS